MRYNRELSNAIRFLVVMFLIGPFINGNAQTWNEIAKFTGEGDDSFGECVAIDGDYAVVGASSYNTYQGCAYVLQNKSGEWQKVAKLTASQSENYDFFGSAVSISGDYIIIGALQHGSGGSAFIFEKPESGWKDTTQTAKLRPNDSIFDSMFGFSVDISGDIALISCLRDNSAYVFEKPVNGWKDTIQTAKLTISETEITSPRATSVGVDHDIIVLGSCNNTGNGIGYVFIKPVAGWKDTTETAKLSCTDQSTTNFFGSSVCVFEDFIAIGAADYHTGGVAYIYEKPVEGWKDTTEIAILTGSDISTGDDFGTSVAMHNNRVVIGALRNDNKGAVYIYDKPENGWSDAMESAKITASNASDDYRFGQGVDIFENDIISGGNGGEFAYIFSYYNVSNINENSILVNEINIYPNPTKDYLTFSGKEFHKLELYDLSGNLLLSEHYSKSPIDLSTLISGMYIIQIFSDEKVISMKIIKE